MAIADMNGYATVTVSNDCSSGTVAYYGSGSCVHDGALYVQPTPNIPNNFLDKLRAEVDDWLKGALD